MKGHIWVISSDSQNACLSNEEHNGNAAESRTDSEVAVSDADGSQSFRRHRFNDCVYHNVLVALCKPQCFAH